MVDQPKVERHGEMEENSDFDQKETEVDASELKMLTFLSGVTRMSRNEIIGGTTEAEPRRDKVRDQDEVVLTCPEEGQWLCWWEKTEEVYGCG